MKSNLIVLAGATAVLVSACGFTPREQALGDFDYVQKSNDGQLQPAPGKSLPKPSNRYVVPNANHDEPIGKDVVILAPKLIWPVADGSRVEESETKIRVYFDELDGMDDVENYVWQGLIQGLRARNWSTTELQEKQRIVTDWLVENLEYGEDEIPVTIRRKIQISMDTAEHGRTTALLAEVVDRQVNAERVQLGDVYLKHKDDNVAAMTLNALISEIAINQAKGVASVTEEGTVNIQPGFDEDGNAAIIVAASFNFTWGIMQEVLPELGFAIDDFNQQTGRYYTSYNTERSGLSALAFWRSRSEGLVNLPSGEYEVKVTGDRKQTAVTLFRAGEAISASEVTEIFGPIAAEIRNQSGL